MLEMFFNVIYCSVFSLETCSAHFKFVNLTAVLIGKLL